MTRTWIVLTASCHEISQSVQEVKVFHSRTYFLSRGDLFYRFSQLTHSVVIITLKVAVETCRLADISNGRPVPCKKKTVKTQLNLTCYWHEINTVGIANSTEKVKNSRAAGH